MNDIYLDDYFTPRPYQLPLINAFHQGYKRLISCQARRSGKDLTAFMLMLEAALHRVGIYWYVWPNAEQGRKHAWNGKLIDGRSFLSLVPEAALVKKNIAEMRLELSNGSTIQIVGSEKIDSLMGGNPCGIILTEYALADNQEAFELLLPMLRGNDGWCIILSTPRGRNSFYRLYQIAQQNPDTWFSQTLTVDDTHHIRIEEINEDVRTGVISWEKAQQEYWCFKGSQHVLLLDEYKPIADVKVNELVLSHNGRPSKVLKTMNREYSGEIISISSCGSYEKIECTPEHPLRVYDKPTQTYSWKKSGDITEDDLLVFPKIPLGKIPVISKELCMLLAWYICDGSSFKNGVQFTVAIRKQERVCELITAIGHTPHVAQVKEEKAVAITIYSTQLVDFFKVNCGTRAEHKRINMSLIGGYEDEFFHELMKGDGCITQEGFCYSTISKLLAYQVQMLANSLTHGYAAGIGQRLGSSVTFPHGKTYECKDSYAVRIYRPSTTKGRTQNLYRTKYGVAARIRGIKRVPYSGKVYNLEVQYDNSYIVGGRSVHNCNWDMGLDSTVYGSAMDRVRAESRIGNVPYDGSYPVFTFWDIGRDMTSIVFAQLVGKEIRVIDYFEKPNENLAFFARKLQEYDYVYKTHFFPHDGKNIEWAGPKATRIYKAQQLGLPVDVVPRPHYIADGIEAARSKLALCWFDEKKCAVLLKCLENYSYEKNERLNVNSKEPRHDWASHGASAFMYMCMAIDMNLVESGMDEDDAERIYKDAMYGDTHSRNHLFEERYYYDERRIPSRRM